MIEKKELEFVQKIEQSQGINIIKDVDIQAMSQSLQKINQFQQTVQKLFTQNHDYGIVPGTSKPTLLKPGAEKLVMLLGLSTEFEIEESTRDFEKGFFQYYIKCTLIKNGTTITEGMGTANTKEQKFIKKDPFTLDNTVLKIAKKRALVDAALLVGSLSAVFTQDIEDMDLAGNKASDYKKTFTDRDGTITQAQAKRMFAISGGKSEIVKEVLNKYKYENSEQVKKIDYENICAEIEDLAKN